MVPLPLKATDRPLLAGDLNVCVTAQALEVPRRVADAVSDQDVRTARQLLSYGQAFPTAMARSLGWSNEQVITAITRLAVQLGAGPTPRRVVAFGARDPSELSER